MRSICIVHDRGNTKPDATLKGGASMRTFEDKPAVREAVPLIIGLCGPSGAGKSFSALRLATGIQRVAGGDIYGIDTEGSRLLYYADQFKFRHVPFGAPFGALDYLAAVEHCVKKGAKTIVIDSASHLHEGPGGTLEAHDAECDRLEKAWRTTRDKVQMSAWQKPKSELRRFINEIVQMNVNLVMCYRAREKLKIIQGKNPQQLGYMPIASEELIFEATLNALLLPGAAGVPAWHPEELGEKAIVKLPGQFRGIFEKTEPLSEDIGESLAKWAAGGVSRACPMATPEQVEEIGTEAARLKWAANQCAWWLKKYYAVERRDHLTEEQARAAIQAMSTMPEGTRPS